MTQANIHERRRHIAALFDGDPQFVKIDFKDLARVYGCSEITIMNDLNYIASTRDGSTIYGLRDPESGLIRYVGQTDGNPQYRYKKHLDLTRHGREKNAVKAQWIADLSTKFMRPELVILERCPFAQLNERERWWIKHYLDQGVELVNRRGNGKRGGRPKTTQKETPNGSA